jgi:transposase
VDTALIVLSPQLAKLYAHTGRPSIVLEKLLRTLLLQVRYSLRSERLLMEALQYNLLFRWFVGLDLDAPVPHFSSSDLSPDLLIEYAPAE